MRSGMDPIYKIVIVLAVLAALLGLALALTPKPPLRDEGTVRAFFTALQSDYEKMAATNDEKIIASFVQHYYAPDALIASAIIAAALPTDALIFEGYEIAADEYAMMIVSENRKIANTKRDKRIGRIVLGKGGRRAKIFYSFESKATVGNDVFAGLEKPLAIRYEGACEMTIAQPPRAKEPHVTDDRCETNVSGSFVE